MNTTAIAKTNKALNKAIHMYNKKETVLGSDSAEKALRIMFEEGKTKKDVVVAVLDEIVSTHIDGSSDVLTEDKVEHLMCLLDAVKTVGQNVVTVIADSTDVPSPKKQPTIAKKTNPTLRNPRTPRQEKRRRFRNRPGQEVRQLEDALANFAVETPEKATESKKKEKPQDVSGKAPKRPEKPSSNFLALRIVRRGGRNAKFALVDAGKVERLKLAGHTQIIHADGGRMGRYEGFAVRMEVEGKDLQKLKLVRNILRCLEIESKDMLSATQTVFEEAYKGKQLTGDVVMWVLNKVSSQKDHTCRIINNRDQV